MKDISDEVVRRKQTQLTTALDPVLHLLNDADVVEVMINPDTRVI